MGKRQSQKATSPAANIDPEQQPDNNAIHLPHWRVTSWQEAGGLIKFYAMAPDFVSPGSDCPECGAAGGLRANGRRDMILRDAPLREKPTQIIMSEQQFQCRVCKKAPKPPRPDIDEKHRMTIRCVEYVKIQSLRRPHSWVARDVGIDEKLVRTISKAHVAELERQNRDRPWKTSYLGIDDIYLSNKPRSIFVDLETGRIVGLEPSHKGEAVQRFLRSIPNNEIIKAVSIDMAPQFLEAVSSALPEAIIVFDKWHILNPALRAMDRARIYTQIRIVERAGTSVGEKANASKQSQMLKKHRHLFRRRRFYNFSPNQRQALDRYLAIYPNLATAFDLKEKFFDIWLATSSADANKRIERWLQAVKESSHAYAARHKEEMARARRENFTFRPDEIDPAILFKKCIETFDLKTREYVTNYFAIERRITNAATEAANGRVKLTQRLGRGYVFSSLRARMLWQEPDLIRERKKHPSKRNRANSSSVSALPETEYRIQPSEIIRHRNTYKAKCASIGCKNFISIDESDFKPDNAVLTVYDGRQHCDICFDARSRSGGDEHDLLSALCEDHSDRSNDDDDDYDDADGLIDEG